MKFQSLSFAVLLVVALALAGCETITEPGAPEQSFDIDQDIQDLEKVFKERGVTIINYYSTEAEKAAAADKEATKTAAEANAAADEATKEAVEAKAAADKATREAADADTAAAEAAQEMTAAMAAAEVTPEDEEVKTTVETATATAEKAKDEAAEAAVAAEEATKEAAEANAAAEEVTKEAAEAAAAADRATEKAKKAAAKVDKKELRDQFLSQRLTLINIQYIKFIRRFAVEKAQLDTAADMLIVGVNLAGTLVGAASTKGILAAISAGTSASRTSINKNFFHEKTVPVLVTAMNAERKEALIPIMEGLSKSVKDYPFGRALSDLHLYYQAGTFIGALQAIQKDSGVKEDKADDEIKRLNVRPVSKELQIRRRQAANFVKTLDQAKLDSLAVALGAKTGDEALVAILRAISQAQTAKDFDVIAQQINVLFDKEI